MSRRLASVAVVLAPVALAAGLAGPGIAQPASAGGWERKTARVEELVERGEWRRAVERAEELRGEMVARIERAGELQEPIARLLVLQAVGEANLGRERAALWHWHAAQNYLDGLPGLDLTGHGRAAEVLAGRSLADVPSVPPTPGGEGRRQRDRAVEIDRAVEPDYPRALRRSGMEGVVSVRVVVGIDGRAHQPVVQEAGLVPTMAFPVLEALAGWRFRPAERGGVAVPVHYELEIRYR